MNKKLSLSLLLGGIFVVVLTTYLAFAFNVPDSVIHEYYQVYLNGKKIGLIESDQALYDMINDEQKDIKEKYGVENIYPPSGLEVQKVNTYSNKITSVKTIYEEIKDLEPFTIEGYQVTVTNTDDKKFETFFILNKEDLDVAIENTITSFLTEEEYKNYLAGIEKSEDEEGKQITNVYFDQEVTLKKTYISTEENIMTNADDLSRYFLFGTLDLGDKYTVTAADTIETIAYNNKLGVSDFLIANPEIVNENALLAIGQEVTVAAINPVANIVVESYDTTLEEVVYETKIEYDKTLNADQTYVKQEGSKGLSKMVYATEYMNGVIMKTAFVSEEVITEPVDRIVVYGGHNITYVGNSTYWAWPTSRPYRISSHYGYRVHPIYHDVRLHDGTDITGTKSDNIYSIQSGVVAVSAYNSSSGNYIKIDHQNGYTSTYLHLAKQLVSVGDKVEKGELIGIMGTTGASTGKHLHLIVTKNGKKINPMTLYQ